MRGRLSSPRFRRRLGWLAILVLVAGLITLAATKYANTGASNATPLIDKPATVYRIPARMHLSKQDRNDLFDVTSRFVRTAVARKHLDSAWNMLGPELKAGQTHKSWDTGFNNVVPFKADGIGLFSILYAYQNDVAIDTGLVSGKGSGWAAKTFTIELKRYPGQPHHWLVASWVPKGIGGGGTLSPSRRAGPPPAAVPVEAVRPLAARSARFLRTARRLPDDVGARRRDPRPPRRATLRRRARLQLQLEPVVDLLVPVLERALGGTMGEQACASRPRRGTPPRLPPRRDARACRPRGSA